MDRSLYIAMSGAKQTLYAQTTNANNLANSQTTGFKSDLEQMRSMPVFGEGYPTRVYAMTERPGVDFTPGAIQTTGGDLDVAIKGDGFFAVQAADGKEAYTRAGDLKLTPEGLLQTGTGLPVMGQGGPISIPPAQKMSIGSDGTISIVPLGGNANATVVVDQIKMVKADRQNVEKLTDGLFHVKDQGQPLAADPNVNLIQGALEGSNVNALQAMVDMIELAKNFELQTKVMKNANDNSGASAKLMQMA
ncbi:MAG: flagellar basal-body rod protein FlgF [Methylovulum sp.]|jgi:flagellar basal-body rod protein FlgF|nr:flagellar basal-body rod protein FlgF [Methylovulum sp.]MCF7998894.1 flagellar basal-body rod protein FlgF [Methylovulum sp.]